MKIKKFVFTITLTLFSPILLFLSLLETGGGHGNFGQLIFLFPWLFCSKALFVFFENLVSGFWVGCFFAILQFFVYGVILDWFRAKNEIKFGLLLMTLLHCILAGLSMILFYR